MPESAPRPRGPLRGAARWRRRVRRTMGALPLLLCCAGQGLAAPAPPPLLTGEVYSRQAQDVIVPLTTNWQSRISTLVPEGSRVEPGDLVVEFDGTEAARQLEQQRETARTERARTERDLARLDKELAQAEFGLRQAQVQLELATLKAEIPEGVIGAIEYAENQLAFEQASKALENALEQRDDRRQLLAERRRQAELDARKVELQEQWWARMLDSFRIYAEQPGFVIYGRHPWTRTKFQEGDTVQTSFNVAQIADTSNLAIRVWVNGVDRPRLEPGLAVQVRLDALADRVFTGLIESLSDSGAPRQEWSDASYFEAVVSLDDDVSALLKPGMSALVEPLP